MKYRTVDQGKYWEVHDWERGFCVATAIPDQDMAEAMAGALNKRGEEAGNDRIKPEPKLVPYGREDAAFLAGRKAKSKLTNVIYLILGFDGERAEFERFYQTLGELFNNYLDVTDSPEGKPFGKVVE